jgi:APA family basic amino acid/polyamine antiporter
MSRIWARKSIAALEAEAEDPQVQSLTTHNGVPLKRSLSALNLVSLGIGAIIGAGIFVLTGHAAAANAGPAITLSFVLGAFACAFAGLTRKWLRPYRLPAAPIPMPTPRWENSSPGSSAGT